VPNHAAAPILKVIKSAAANALESWGAGTDELKVSNVIADGGPILKRIRARAQGRAYRILKRTSHLTVVLTEAPKPVAKRRVTAKPKAKAVTTAAAPAKKAPAAKASAPAEAIAETPVEATNAGLQTTAPTSAEQPTAEASSPILGDTGVSEIASESAVEETAATDAEPSAETAPESEASADAETGQE
jgi:hypothetical protein